MYIVSSSLHLVSLLVVCV